MSQAVFPSLSGLSWNVGTTPTFSTKVQRSVSGRELRSAFMAYPLWEFTLTYEFLTSGNRGSDLQTLCGFFLARQGMYDDFLYTVPQDNTVSAMQFGTGNGTTTAFQLTRSFGAGGFSFAEPVMNLNGTPTIYVNGTPTAVSVSGTGVVTFSTAPAAAAVLTWSGSFYYRCRFGQDTAEFSAFMQDLFELKKIQFVGSPGNKV